MNENYFVTLLKTHKLLFAFISLSIIAALTLLLLLFLSFTTPAPQSPSTETPNITPGIAKDNLTILSVSPKNNSINIQVFPKISITFSRPVTAIEKSTIKIVATPEIVGTREWSSTGTVLSITPSEALTPNQRYVLKTQYYSEEFLWSFTTVPLENISYEDQIQIQAAGDKKFNEIQEKTAETYPWLQNLPLQEENYFVYFDVDKKQMIAKLYPKIVGDIPVEQQEETMKNQILSRLQALGVDTTIYPPTWVSQPEY